MKIWIVDDRTHKDVVVKEVDAWRVVEHQHSPPGMARYNYRKLKNGEYKWSYVHYGETREIAVASFNEYWNGLLNELTATFERQAASLRARMAK